MGPLITTIIPTYKRPQLLKKAIESVLNQTYPHFTLCIYDNASDDATEEVALSYVSKDARVKYYKHRENIGATANFAFGLTRVETLFFSFLSDDDILLPNFYETALEGFKKYPEAGFFCGTVILSNEVGRVIHVTTLPWKDTEYYEPPGGLFEMIPKHLDWMGILFKKEVRDQIGGIDTQIKAIDVDFLYRAAARYPFVVSKKPCGIFFQHSQSYSYYAGLKVIWPGWLSMLENIKKDPLLSPDDILKVEQLFEKDINKKLIFVFIHNLKRKDFVDCIKVLQVLKGYCKRSCLVCGLLCVVRLVQWIPLLHPVFCLMLKARQLLLKRKRVLQRSFGSYLGLLQGGN